MSINSDSSPAETNTPTTEVEGLRRLVEEQRKLIDKLSKQLQNQKERIEQLEAELRAKKKLKGKPKLSASLLNQPESEEKKADKRAGSAKESKKSNPAKTSSGDWLFGRAISHEERRMAGASIIAGNNWCKNSPNIDRSSTVGWFEHSRQKRTVENS